MSKSLSKKKPVKSVKKGVKSNFNINKNFGIKWNGA